MKQGWPLVALCLFWAIGSGPADTSRGEPATSGDEATRAKILRYVRDKFGIPDNVKMIVWPLQPFDHPDFYKVTVTAQSEDTKQTQEFYLTKDRRYLLVGKAYPLGADINADIARHVREALNVPPSTRLTVGNFRQSPIPYLLVTPVTADDGQQRQRQDFYVTGDNRFLFVVEAHNLNIDPRREALRMMSLSDQPSRGPENAPVTVVEYSDLQCASCARFHEFLLHELLPKYQGKVRVVFKEFPLVSIHDWSLAGSIACQCVYQLNPTLYVAYRTLVFQNQTRLNATNARDQLLLLGEQIGVDRLQLATCLDAKVSLQRVEENFREGQLLGVHSTPTSFVNGRKVIGLSSPADFYRIVDEALRSSSR